jgi:hypothetical protein
MSEAPYTRLSPRPGVIRSARTSDVIQVTAGGGGGRPGGTLALIHKFGTLRQK